MRDKQAKTTILVAGIFMCAVLAACGRKGPLEPPPGNAVSPSSQADQSKTQTNDRRIALDALI